MRVLRLGSVGVTTSGYIHKNHCATVLVRSSGCRVQRQKASLDLESIVLEGAGYLSVGKSFAGKMPRTSLTLTKQGRAAWKAHLATLREIAQGPS